MRSFLLLLIISMAVSCNSKQVASNHIAIPTAWEKHNAIPFNFKAPDSTQPYNLFFTVRNTNAYEFSNLFVITTLKSPQQNTTIDTLEYEMAAPNGKWLGDGFLEAKEHKLWYKEQFIFPQNGTYTLTVEHAMRENGSVLGVSNLKGIIELGFSIEHTKTH